LDVEKDQPEKIFKLESWCKFFISDCQESRKAKPSKIKKVTSYDGAIKLPKGFVILSMKHF